MTKADVIRVVAKTSGYNKTVVGEVLEQLIEVVKSGLVLDGIVRIGGLGAFVVKTLKGRPYYPAHIMGTQVERVMVPDRNTVRLEPSPGLKEAVQ
jgi:nucleoid DNA-binding protein